jgi:hypothetical protein
MGRITSAKNQTLTVPPAATLNLDRAVHTIFCGKASIKSRLKIYTYMMLTANLKRLKFGIVAKRTSTHV